MNEKKRGKQPRVLTKTCSGQVLNRILKELRITLYDIRDATGIPYTTLFDWSTGRIPTNPEQLERVLIYLQTFDPKYTFTYFYFGTDQDREELKRKLEEKESENTKLEFELYNLKNQLSFFEEIEKAEKKSSTRSAHTENESNKF